MLNASNRRNRFSVDLLKSNHFCIGVKRGKKYRCGDNANEDAISNAVELLIKAIERILRWRVWETQWIEETMDKLLGARKRVETQLRGKYSDDVVNNLLKLVDELINYNEQFLNYWRDVDNEVRKLIEDLLNGRAEVIIWKGEKGISVYRKRITLETHKTSTGGVTVHLVLNDLEGITIKVPDIFKKVISEEEYEKIVKKVLKALKGGLEETDGTIDRGKACMSTTQVWQAIVWSLLYPGEIHMRINNVNVNDSDVTILWRLKTSHEPLKGKILNDVEKLGEEELLAFMLGVVLGDGWADIAKVVINGRIYDEAVIKITMASRRFNAWKSLLERLKGMGFNWKPELAGDGVVDVRFYGSNAIELARAMINALPPILKDILDALAFEKWERIKRIAEMEVRWRRGESQVIVAGYKFMVDIQKNTVDLRHQVRDGVEAERVVDALRAMYGDELAKYVRINKNGRRLAVIIPMRVLKKYDDIKEQVIKVLCRKLERVKDERRRQIITKHLTRLIPTERQPRGIPKPRTLPKPNPGN